MHLPEQPTFCCCILQGYNASIVAYGQTGTGKTYTMEGERVGPVSVSSACRCRRLLLALWRSLCAVHPNYCRWHAAPPAIAPGTSLQHRCSVPRFSGRPLLQARGIIPRAIEDVFGYIQRDTGERCKFLVRASYLQIYNEVGGPRVEGAVRCALWLPLCITACNAAGLCRCRMCCCCCCRNT